MAAHLLTYLQRRLNIRPTDVGSRSEELLCHLLSNMDHRVLEEILYGVQDEMSRGLKTWWESHIGVS